MLSELDSDRLWKPPYNPNPSWNLADETDGEMRMIDTNPKNVTNLRRWEFIHLISFDLVVSVCDQRLNDRIRLKAE